MKSNPSTKEIHDALARLEKAKGERTNAQRRLSRAKEAVDKATKEVAEGEEEFKAASTNLDQAIRRGMATAMKKGGADTSIRLAEIIAQSLGGPDDGDPTPAPAPSPSPAPTPEPAAPELRLDAGPTASEGGDEGSSARAAQPAEAE